MGKEIGKGFLIIGGIALLVLIVLLALGWRPTSVGIEAGPVSIELAPATPFPTATIPRSRPQASPTPVPIERFQTISLEPYSELSAPETNLGLAPGQYALSEGDQKTGFVVS
jgi:hypothetical protein